MYVLQSGDESNPLTDADLVQINKHEISEFGV
jgi:hypothetical protein